MFSNEELHECAAEKCSHLTFLDLNEAYIVKSENVLQFTVGVFHTSCSLRL